MPQPILHRILAMVSIAVVTAAVGTVVVCPVVGLAPAWTSAPCCPAGGRPAASDAAHLGSGCPGAVSTQSPALQASDEEAAPAAPASPVRLAERGGAEAPPFPASAPHSFHEGTAVYLVVSSFLI